MDGQRPASVAAEQPQAIQTRAELAHGLTALRVRCGLTVRELSRRLDTPTATLGDYFSGRHLPGPAQLDLFRALLAQCGVSDDQAGGWLDALARVRLSSDARVTHLQAPYRGLEPFAAEDAELFFGREAATEEILTRLRELELTADELPLLMLVAPSGAGKSSLLRAGVGARVRAGAPDGTGHSWDSAVITPGETPTAALWDCLVALRGEHRLVIIDQFEELFTAGEDEREQFLHTLASLRAPRTLVLAGLRADFYEQAMREPLLLPALAHTQLLLAPMTEPEARRAIIEPAQRFGVPVEEGLVELLLSDLAPGSATGFAHDSGALPLLSHALLATWERARRNRLTIADYRAVGGLRGAVSQSAEGLYGTLDRQEQGLARQIFCRLARVEGDGPVTRRRIARHELEELDGARSPDAVLRRFIDARLITVDAATVELSHEALLQAWPRLANWLEQDRADLRLRHQLTEAANTWVAAEADQSLLLRGTRLHAISDWAAESDHAHQLNRAEREFLEASTALAQAERRTARRRARRTQQLLGVVAVLAIAALVLALVAFHAKHAADLARDQALSRQVAIEAGNLEPTDPALAEQLALAAYRISPTTQATSTLLDTSASEMPTRLLGPIGPSSIALGDGGHVLAVAYSGSDRVKLYALSAARLRPLAGVRSAPASASTYAVALSHNGQLLAAGSTDGRVLLWSLVRPAHPLRLATLSTGSGTVYGLSFSPDGGALAAADSDGTVARWSLSAPAHPTMLAPLRAPGKPALQAVSYSPDGGTIAAAGADGALDVWRATGTTTDNAPLARITAAATTLTSVAYSPDGLTLAAGGQDALVYLWKIGSNGAPGAQHAPLRGFSSWVDSLTFSHDGRYLAAGDSDESVRIWSTRHWRDIAKLEHPAPVTGLAFTPGDRQLLSVDEDGTTRIWQFPPPSTLTVSGSLYDIDFTSGGGEMATVTGGPDGDAELWKVTDPLHPTALTSVRMPAAFGAVAAVGALSPDGKLLAVGNAAAKVQLVDLSRPQHPRLLGGPLSGAVPYIEQVNFSPNMKLLSVGDDAGRIHIWDISDPEHPVALPTIDRQGKSSNVFGVAYSPDGDLVAVACADHKVWLWDIANPHQPKLLATLGGFSSYAYTVAFSPSGKTLIAGSADDTVRIWNVSEPAHPRLLARLRGPTSTVYQVAVSPDGSMLAASTTDQQVWLWNIRDPADPRLVAELTAATGEIFDVSFSPNDRTLAAGGTDDAPTFWDYRPSQVAARICSVAGSPITRSEWAEYVQGATYRPPCR
ncbi:MAG: helix-turn-helix domain-containing protein [Solirubrobacteraceae bacterium]